MGNCNDGETSFELHLSHYPHGFRDNFSIYSFSLTATTLSALCVCVSVCKGHETPTVARAGQGEIWRA
jgi:hypothetical protein